jgi:hypothetical protein
MDWTAVMTPAQAERIAKLEINDIVAILKISSLSQKPEDVLQIAQSIKGGQAAKIPEDVLSSGPKPLHIIANSFVRDKNQYSNTYGVSDKKAAELASLLRTNEEDAREQIKQIVRARVMMKGSEREVEVMLTQAPAPRSTTGNATTAPEGDGGAKELAAEIAKRPAIYGQHQFEPESTGNVGQFQYRIHLGDDLFVRGQSKKVVIAAARICRVKGRFDEMVRPHIWYWTSWSPPVGDHDIPDTVWDGKQSAMAPVRPQKTVKTKVQQTEKKRFDEGEMMVEDLD